jgi:hypothetical protein
MVNYTTSNFKKKGALAQDMIYQIFEDELNDAFDSLLDSIDLANQKVIRLILKRQNRVKDEISQGLGVELQGKVLFFRDVLLEQIRNDLDEA